jgi:hypothetical protein
MPVEEPAEPIDRASLDRWRGIGPGLAVLADVGEGVRRRSGVADDVGDEFPVAEAGVFGFGDFD